MPEFRLPTTPEQWAAVVPNETDEDIQTSACDCDRALDLDRIAAAARLLERERCVAALDAWLAYRYGIKPWEGTDSEARRILEDK